MTEAKVQADIWDVIIIGGGPAGMCAAMYAGRGMLRALLIERGLPGGELLNTEKIEDYPGFESILGPELAKRMADHARKFGATFVTDTVDTVKKRDDGDFDIATQMGKAYRARAVIVTAGGTPNKLGVAGEKEYAGRGVSYCAVCDGAFFKQEVIAVIHGHAGHGKGVAAGAGFGERISAHGVCCQAGEVAFFLLLVAPAQQGVVDQRVLHVHDHRRRRVHGG